ncbi:hypothetical protein KJ570_00805, partial [Patescibacteria group bacterium]|nr:hypothetical protein [Patescibacteria group bacterium]
DGGKKRCHNLWYNLRVKNKLPLSFKPYFWDIDFSKLSLDNTQFIIKRVLDRGDTNSIKWLINNYSKKDIKDTIMKSRDLSQKTANFWADLYKIDRTKILCLQKRYSPIQFGLSS